MTLHAPQLIFIALLVLGTGVSLAKHGQPKEGRHNFTLAVLSDAIVIGLLYWGGFFSQ